MKAIRVLIVDDSAFVRKALLRIFQSDSGIEVVGAAASGAEAIEKVQQLRPDVITLDVMMPGMDGIETLRTIMETAPTPVLMLSQLTKQGAELTLRALELGALDFIDKSSTAMMDFFDLGREVIAKVRSISGSRPLRLMQGERTSAPAVSRGLVDVVAIGTSTGGPLALRAVLPKFPATVGFGVLVVQHMPHGFTEALAKRLDTVCDMNVKEAEEGDEIVPGLVLVAPAGLHMTVTRTGGRRLVSLDVEPVEELHRPSVDVLFRSVAEHFGQRAVGVIMTGMGADGARGLGVIRERGGFTIAQDEATSAVFGMPRVAIERGAAERVLPVTEIAGEILRLA